MTEVLDILWEIWNNDPALMNTVSGLVTGVVTVLFYIVFRVKKKEHNIVLEVGDVKRIVPVVQDLVESVLEVKKQLDKLEKKVDGQNDMFYTTFNSTKISNSAKEIIKKQYLALKDRAEDLIEATVEEVEELVESIEPEEISEVESIYNSFKGESYEEENQTSA